MPDFWQFPTVSMGLGPLMATYQARFLKYLQGRGLADTAPRKVWTFMGDGEMDEPESLGANSLTSRENLDNLIFVINCNLQRLDGPVRGNGKIVQALESVFRGAGWNVIKVLWGSGWDALLAQDKSSVATRPITDLPAYRQRLSQFVYPSGSSMQPLFAAAKRAPRRVVYAEGEDERVLRAAKVVVDEGLARPQLLGRAEVITRRIAEFGLRLVPGTDCDLVNLLDPAVYGPAADAYFQLRRRDGVSRAVARAEMRSRSTLLAAMQMLMLTGRQLFICDTHVNRDPSAELVAEIALLAAEAVRRFGVTPSVALLSHSNFGSSDAPSAAKMRQALGLVKARDPALAVEGEMRGDSALSKSILDHELPDSGLSTEANVLVMPNVDAANISYNLLRVAAGGGILLGAARPVHILTPSSTVRRIVNMTALAVADAGSQAQ
jgi:malate dehydrogenase (oxaloacetate-decarboxylating)(NADP+)